MIDPDNINKKLIETYNLSNYIDDETYLLKCMIGIIEPCEIVNIIKPKSDEKDVNM